MKIVRVTTFPSTDAAFEAQVAAARERLGAWDADRVLGRVRRAYPEATARRAADVAVLEPNIERWYVYRDGVALGAAGSIDGWDDQSLPRAIVGSADPLRCQPTAGPTIIFFGCLGPKCTLSGTRVDRWSHAPQVVYRRRVA